MRPGSMVVNTMATTFVERIHATKHWTSAAIIQLIGEVQNMELPEAMKESIQKAVETCQTNEGSHVKLSSCGQKVIHVPTYLTTGDWQALESAVSKDDQMSIMAKRLRAIGLCSLKENTVHQVLATLLYINHGRGQPPMHPRAIHSMVDDFHAIFHGTAKVEGVPKLATYCEDPLQNGEAWLSKAYTNGTSPSGKVLPLHAWYRKVPMRKNHHLLVHGDHESKKGAGGAQSHANLAKAAQLLSQLADRWNPAPPAEPEITLLQPRQDRLALQNLPTPQQRSLQVQPLPLQQDQAVQQEAPLQQPMELQQPLQQPLQLQEPLQQAALQQAPLQQTPVQPAPVQQTSATAHEAGSQAALQPDPMLAAPDPDVSTEKPTSKARTLQEFEEQHFHELKKRKAEAKAKAKPKAKAKAKAEAKAKAKAKAGGKPKTKTAAKAKASPKAKAKSQEAKRVPKNQGHLPPHKRDPPIFGCPKCRGNPNGCGQCLDPNYTGLRLPGREAYRAHMARRARAAK